MTEQYLSKTQMIQILWRIVQLLHFKESDLDSEGGETSALKEGGVPSGEPSDLKEGQEDSDTLADSDTSAEWRSGAEETEEEVQVNCPFL